MKNTLLPESSRWGGIKSRSPPPPGKIFLIKSLQTLPYIFLQFFSLPYVLGIVDFENAKNLISHPTLPPSPTHRTELHLSLKTIIFSKYFFTVLRFRYGRFRICINNILINGVPIRTFRRKSFKHSEHFVDPVTHCHTNSEGM